MIACREISAEVGTAAGCNALDLARATFYRHLKPGEGNGNKKRAVPPRALAADERGQALQVMHQERFIDRAPAAIYASLLDEGIYLCSIRTMYRILAAEGEVRERRNQLRHPHYQAPELVATAPNQVWTWDITKLRGPVKWLYYYLYVILDLFSRYVVGWMVATHENGVLAKHLIAETCRKEGVRQGQVALHADRGSPMMAKPVALLLADLGIARSHSRPHVSNDNPYSESQFKTLKYSPAFPRRFGSLEDARNFCRRFFHWYNNEHRHSGIGLMSPAVVHQGRAEELTRARQTTLEEAFKAHPERFVRGIPKPPLMPEAVWINKPRQELDGPQAGTEYEQSVIPGVVGYGSEEDRQSWGILDAESIDPAYQVPVSNTKFESRVSQNH